MDIQTPNVIVSSQGKNDFGVAYDPTSKKSYVAACQYPVQVQSIDGSQVPFILEFGQVVEIGNSQVSYPLPPARFPEKKQVRIKIQVLFPKALKEDAIQIQ